MTDITIYLPDGNVWNTTPITEAAKCEQELMKTDQVSLIKRKAD